MSRSWGPRRRSEWAHLHRKSKTEPNCTEPNRTEISVFLVFGFGFGSKICELRSSVYISVSSFNSTETPNNRNIQRQPQASHSGIQRTQYAAASGSPAQRGPPHSKSPNHVNIAQHRNNRHQAPLVRPNPIQIMEQRRRVQQRLAMARRRTGMEASIATRRAAVGQRRGRDRRSRSRERDDRRGRQDGAATMAAAADVDRGGASAARNAAVMDFGWGWWHKQPSSSSRPWILKCAVYCCVR